MPPRAKTELVTYGVFLVNHGAWLRDESGKIMEFFSKPAAEAQADSAVSWSRDSLAVVQFGQKVPRAEPAETN